MSLSKKAQEVYLEGLKKYQERGVSIYVDGELSEEPTWPLLLGESDDSSFYMGDYILDESDGSLVEIRFTKCYLNKEGGLNRTPKVE